MKNEHVFKQKAEMALAGNGCWRGRRTTAASVLQRAEIWGMDANKGKNDRVRFCLISKIKAALLVFGMLYLI